MSGSRLFLDTNAIVQLLAGNPDVVCILADAEYVATSVICELEFLAFPALSAGDKDLLRRFLSQIDVFDLATENEALKERIVDIRARKGMKLPDAIIAASAGEACCTLLTADKHFLECPELDVREFKMSK